MSCQPVLAYADALREAAHDHEPAKRPLRPAQNEQRRYLRDERLWNSPARQEINEGQEEYKAGKAPEQPVRPLPPIDSFEVLKADPLIDQLILGDVAIFLEGLPPHSLV